MPRSLKQTAVRPQGQRERRESTGQRETGNTLDNKIRQEAAIRWNECVVLLNARVLAKDRNARRITYKELGEMLADVTDHRETAYDQSIIYRMQEGTRAIRLEDCQAMARLLKKHGIRVDPGWIALGDDTEASPPDRAALAHAKRVLATH